jgi:hypothetical protein
MPYVNPLTFDALLVRMQKPLTFLRFGDGDWFSILDDNYAPPLLGAAATADAVVTLMDEIRTGVRTVRGPIYGMQPLANAHPRRPEIDAWIAANCPDVEWHSCDTLHEASEAGDLRRFVTAAESRNLVMVGPRYLKALKDRIKPAGWVFTNEWDNHLEREQVRDELLAHQARLGSITACVSGFLVSKALGFSLWPDFKSRSSFIDCGSLWDPHCGRKTRLYHHRMRAKDLL